MLNQIWILQAVLALITAVFAGTEILPERYLQPQDFNYHPFTDVEPLLTLKKQPSNPYAILSRKKPREGRNFPLQDVIFYPTPHPSVITRKQIETNKINKYVNPYIPKKYVFSYTVKDQHSGDDFSHSQVHNGKATKGQYRVKLPDGRTQIVNYTADHKGYRADIHYENELSFKPINKIFFQSVQSVQQTPVELSEIDKKSYPKYKASVLPTEILSSDAAKIVYTATPSYKQSANYITSSSTASPVQYVPGSNSLLPGNSIQLVVKSTPSPQYYEKNYAHSTPASPIQNQYALAEKTKQHNYVSLISLYAVNHAPTTVSPLTYLEHQNYPHVSSQSVIITSTPVYSQPLDKSNHQHSTGLHRLA